MKRRMQPMQKRVETEYLQRAFEFACLHCGAKAGELCHDPKGATYPHWFHKERVLAAMAAKEVGR